MYRFGTGLTLLTHQSRDENSLYHGWMHFDGLLKKIYPFSLEEPGHFLI